MHSLPILTFHAVDDQPSVISFSPRLFEHGMACLHEAGYRTLSLLELVDYLRRGVAFPERSIALTFDDGYRSVYKEAFPVLRRYQMTASVFLTVGKTKTERLPSMEGRPMLSWSEIREMQQAGIAFGGHTMTHPDLTRLPEKLIATEILGGKAVIEDALGIPVASFAYPFGCYDMRCQEIVSSHFVCACSDKLGLLRINSDRYAMERVDAYYLRSDRLFHTVTTPILPWYVRARSVPRRVRRALIPSR
jgi:peptidoglycan/xylan/chitin deacetylase (PgdA/CDA1 family)